MLFKEHIFVVSCVAKFYRSIAALTVPCDCDEWLILIKLITVPLALL